MGTDLSVCAGEGFGFWPLCRSCLGEESLPVAFLSREPIGRIKGETFSLIATAGDATLPTAPSQQCKDATFRPTTSCQQKAKSNSSHKRNLVLCTPRLQGEQKTSQDCAPWSAVQNITCGELHRCPSSCWNKAPPPHF